MNRGSYSVLAARQTRLAPASMRPRFMNRGSEPRCPGTVPGWGFNEAPIHESGKYGRRFGRKPAAAWASMRPRFMNRGSAQVVNWKFVAADASMRPRFMNRGSERQYGEL